MAEESRNIMYRINCLTSELDALYHRAAVRLGLADSDMFLLYLLYEKNGKCPLSSIRGETGISKQTVNSAVRKMEREGLIYLEQSGGRAKTACLTEKGKTFAENTVARLFAAESGIFNSWSGDEINTYLYLLEKHNNDFLNQIEKM